MIQIDRYAYNSKLKKTDPMQKLVFSVLTLGVCLWADMAGISAAVFLIMVWVTVYKSGMPIRCYVKLLLIPMTFLIAGVLTIAVDISGKTDIFLISFSIGQKWIGISNTGLQSAAGLFIKAIGAVSCLYYLSLSTPLVDLLAALRRLKMPKLLVEMMGLVYRFIFILLETAEAMFTAQSSRLGYMSLSSGYRSLGALVSTLFIRAYKRSQELYTALEARGYDGELNVLEEHYERHWTGYVFPLLVNTLLIIAAL